MEAGKTSFMGEYCNLENAKAVVIPVPFERTTSYMQGTAMGPNAIIEASCNVELYDIELDSEPYLQGIHTLPALSFHSSEKIEHSIEKIKGSVLAALQDHKWPVILGGEHTISYPVYLALEQFYPNLSILHLDAHSDLRDEYLNDPFSHACVMRRIRDHNKNTVSVGIRSMCVEESIYIKEDKPVIYFDHAIQKNGLPIDQILSHLTENVFITFDLDGVNPAELPSVGTPEPGGLSWQQVNNLFKEVFSSKNVVGIDMVELKPDNVNIHSDFWAAKMLYRMIGLKFR